jgi:hypothetical protein
MAITTAYEYRLAIQEELLGRYEEISESPYGEDLLNEMTDSWVPVYNGEIIALWSNEMPNEWDDSWKELAYDGYTNGLNIVGLMRIDIYNWLSALVREIWDEIEEQKEEVA